MDQVDLAVTVGFSQPVGMYDDLFRSLALGIYATVTMEPEPFLAVIPRE